MEAEFWTAKAIMVVLAGFSIDLAVAFLIRAAKASDSDDRHDW